MERRLIRKKWQVTIPRGVRARLNLFQGQLLNWEVVDEEGFFHIKIWSGLCPTAEDKTAYDEFLYKKERQLRRSKCAKKIGKLEEKRSLKLREEREGTGSRSELKSLVSEFSQYLLSLQEKL